MPGLARTFTFLGTGTSVGVPMVGCSCAVCLSTNPRNHRYRCSVLIGTPQGNILIDTAPELRLQLLREKVRAVHAVLFTHYHADHLFGLDDVRPLCRQLGGPMPLYCTGEVEDMIRQAFAYAFAKNVEHLPPGYIPKLVFRQITEEPFTLLGQQIVPIPLIHAQFNVFGFRIGNVAYCTDVNRFPERSWPFLEGLQVLVLERATAQATRRPLERRGSARYHCPSQTGAGLLTHIAHELDHEATNAQLPPGVELAYDGLKFEF